jgi:hypothetical protein
MMHRLDSVLWHVSTCSHLVYPQRSFSHSHATRDKERECLCRRRTRNYRENGTTSVHSVLSECGESCTETNDMIKWLSESIPRAIVKCWMSSLVWRGANVCGKRRQVRSKTKVLLANFFGQDGVVHHEFAPEDHTINKKYYLQVVQRLRGVIRRKRPQEWSSGNWQIHHINVPAHSSQLVEFFLIKHAIPHVQQLTYSSDLAPCDFFLISQNKNRCQRVKIWRCGNHKTKYDAATLVDVKNWLPQVFWATEKSLE